MTRARNENDPMNAAQNLFGEVFHGTKKDRGSTDCCDLKETDFAEALSTI